MLHKDFTQADPSHQCLFALLGSLSVKAALKMLVKLTPADIFKG